MNEKRHRRILPHHSSGSGHTFASPRQSSIKDPILSKRVCFYKSGDPQFNGLPMVINNRTFKTFDALLDSLSKKVPLPFGVRNITTPQGVHAINTLDELEDGKSYICSDTRKVKPINLAKARKKLPPWYHARPVSSRRRTVQQARHFPGRSIHKQEPVVVRTPKKLLVFQNGDPSVKHTVVLHKRSSPNFESILEYVSELMQFHVVKLHTPDGRRVDGLPGLIMCSGTVVAAGREPFKSANYNTQKSPASTQLPTKRAGLRRLKLLKRKKKSLSHSSKSRKFSPSSEQYIVNQIHDSMAESSWDDHLPNNPANSDDFESSHILQSIAESEGSTCLGDGPEGQGVVLPTEDDIEKSFCVNQDGSMTVEMRVRLTIKEEETVRWTTTVSRSSVANQLNASCLAEAEAEQEICSSNSEALDLQSSTSSIDNFNMDKIKHGNDKDFPYVGNSISEKSNEDGVVGSYSYNEQIENGAVTEQYCLVKQSTTRPVPKPRRLSSLDASNVQSRNISTFKSAGMTEILQVGSSGEEVTETVLHIYEQQTCQDNFLANMCAQHMSAARIPFGRPATSETGKNDFEPDPWRPSTASESISIWRTEKTSVPSDLTLSSMMTNQQQQFTKGKDKPEQSQVSKGKRLSPKPRVINKRVRRLLTPVKRRKGNSAEEIRTKVKTFSSAEHINRIYGNKSKRKMKPKKKPTQIGNNGVTKQNLQPLDDKTKSTLKNLNIPSPLTENASETASLETNRLNVSSNNVSQLRGTLVRQTSLHQGENKSGDINKSPGLPHSSSSITNEYVQKWLEKTHFNPTFYPDVENKTLEAAILAQKENSSCEKSEHNHGLITAAEEGKCLVEESVIQPCQSSEFDPMFKNYLRSSVRQRILHFENKSNHSQERAAGTQPEEIALGHATTANTENHTSVAQNDTEEIKACLNDTGYEISPEMSSGTTMENKSSPVKSASNILMDQLLLPPPPAEIAELSNTEHCTMDVSSVVSSPFYRLSSVSSQMSEHQPLSISSTSVKAISPDDHTMETNTSQEEATLSRTPSIKRALLASDQSFERKMSLRKASLQRYTVGSDTKDVTPINAVGDDANVLPNGISSGTLLLKCNPTCCTSASPRSITSGERMSSVNILSSDDPTLGDIPSTKTKNTKTQTQKEASSPKPQGKKVMSSPSQKRKPQSDKTASELAIDSKRPLHNQHSDKIMSKNVGRQTHATPTKEKRKTLYEDKMQKRPSPYSQSLDMTSPPVRPKSTTIMLSRKVSSDNASESENSTKRKTSSQRKHQVTQTDKCAITDEDKSVPQTQIMPQQFKITNQPNMKPVLDKICYSIKSIRQIIQNKRPSCLEKSNSLPDFSAHVASTFGSSSKALLAFLCITTLKEGKTNFNKDDPSLSNVSCADALKMIECLREIASIEDSHKLRDSLSHLKQSTSKQLLQSWKGFQELSDKCKSRSSSEEGHIIAASPKNDYDIEENVINQIIDSLDIPEKLKDELALLSEVKTQSDEEMNVDVPSIIEKCANINQPNKSDENSQLRQSDVARSPPIGEDQNNRQLYDAENRESFSSCKEENVGEKNQQEHESGRDTTNKNGEVSCKRDLENPEVERRQLKMQSEDFPTEDEEGKNFSSATKDVESSKKSMYGSEILEEHSSEEERVKGEEIKQERDEDSSYSDSHSQEEENKQLCSDDYEELNVGRRDRIFSPDSANLSLSEEETQEVNCKTLCEKEPTSQKPQLNVRVDQSTGNSDVEEPNYSEDEQSELELRKVCLALREKRASARRNVFNVGQILRKLW
ncbi:oxygen-regulated protein 1-like [Solea senegalensis]|uniref:Oxygen-regulated protein 1-like n=1 Tax=Solea senegalensis TaxID=28829 RepID=A0AAV6T3G5_SOLSE|nr:oxygen-regulated protein 1-like [Solea senegalensis]